MYIFLHLILKLIKSGTMPVVFKAWFWNILEFCKFYFDKKKNSYSLFICSSYSSKCHFCFYNLSIDNSVWALVLHFEILWRGFFYFWVTMVVRVLFFIKPNLACSLCWLIIFLTLSNISNIVSVWSFILYNDLKNT